MEKSKNKEKFLVQVFSVVIIVLVFILGYIIGRSGFEVVWEKGSIKYSFQGSLYPEEKEIDFGLFWEVWDMLEKKYVEKDINKEEMFYGSIKGMVSSLGDSATRFFTPSETASYEFERSGGFEGVGIELGYLDGSVVVKKVFEGSPASRSEISKGDKIIKVDGQDVTSLEIYDVARNIRGEKGSMVEITVRREEKEIDIDIQRDTVYVESIEWEKIENGIVIINVRRFTESDFESFTMLWDKVIVEVEKESPKGIIVDLRGNGGGFLDGAVYLAGEFLEKGKVVLYVENREEEYTPYKIAEKGEFLNVPLILLVDSETASSSEIFAGALQYYGRAMVIGEDTFGKGTAQDVIKPSSWGGSSIHITTQKWLLPDKTWINKDNPISPDITVEISVEQMKDGEDPQLDRALLEIQSEM